MQAGRPRPRAAAGTGPAAASDQQCEDAAHVRAQLQKSKRSDAMTVRGAPIEKKPTEVPRPCPS